MQVAVGIENNVEGRSLAWALDYPGCFGYGANGDAALAAMPAAWRRYATWIADHAGGAGWIEMTDVDFSAAETWEVYAISEAFELTGDGYEVNAWFLHDWKPLSEQDVARAMQMFAWSRADLLNAVSGLADEALSTEYVGERWSIAGILKHVGGAEWWYLDRLGLAFQQELVPKDPFMRLSAVRERLLEVLPSFIGLQQVVGVDGEFWSPRKLLRRAIWHERDHTQHIGKLRGTS